MNDETRECRFISHVVRNFRTMDPSDYQLEDSVNQEYEAIGFYYVTNPDGSPYKPPSPNSTATMKGFPGAQSSINLVMLSSVYLLF